MKDFLLKNWYYLILASIAIAGLVLTIISVKKKVKSGMGIIESIKLGLLENIPFWISISEGIVGSENKRNNFLSLGIAFVRKMLGRDPSSEETDYFIAFLEDKLEKTLATPQKKLQAPKTAQSGKYRAN